MEKIRYERELCEPLREYLTRRGFTVRSEVNACDLVAKRADLLAVVEMKRHLSFDLLAQAVERQTFADVVYLAVPKPESLRLDKAWRGKLRVLRQLGLGLLLVGRIGECYTVEEALAPGPGRVARAAPKKRKALDGEFGNRLLDLNTGGSRGVPLVTAYRQATLYVVHLLASHGPLTPKELRDLGADPKRTTAILRADHYGWFVKGDDGRYFLTDAGQTALATYEPMITAFRQAASSRPADQGA